MAKYIYSTLTCAQAFTLWAESENKNLPPRRLRQVIIEGGANVATKNLITPRGTVTKVSDKDYEEILKDHRLFKLFVDDGRFIVQDKEATDPDKVYDKLKDKDNHAPLTKGAKSAGQPSEEEQSDSAA